MMLPIAGTVRNTVKIAEMTPKWEQKKKDGKILEQDMDPEVRQLKQYEEDMKKIRKGNEIASIHTKIYSGSELTSEELEYLKKNNPDLYRQYTELLC